MKCDQLLNRLDKEQTDLVMRSKDFLSARTTSISSPSDPDLYLNSWARVRGNARLRIIQNGIVEIPYYFMRLLADFRGYLIHDSWVPITERGFEKKYERIILSWGISTDIDNNGVYQDRYFSTSSAETPDTLWIVIYSENESPKHLDENVVLIYRPRLTFHESFLKFFKTLVNSLVKPSFLNDVCSEICTIVMQELYRDSTIVKVILPYEAQPFQQTLFEHLKIEFPNVLGVGYLHSSPPPLPTDLIYRKGCPSKLFVHGCGVKEMLCEHLDWPQSSITVIDSLRYNRVNLKNFSNEILLPYSFENSDIILKSLNILLKESLINDIISWNIRNHPIQHASKKHIELIKSIESILDNSRNTNQVALPSKKQTVMIGATAAILEALECGLEVIHIVSDPVYEAHTSSIWKYIDVECLGEHLYLYRLKQTGKYIKKNNNGSHFSIIFDE